MCVVWFVAALGRLLADVRARVPMKDGVKALFVNAVAKPLAAATSVFLCECERAAVLTYLRNWISTNAGKLPRKASFCGRNE